MEQSSSKWRAGCTQGLLIGGELIWLGLAPLLAQGALALLRTVAEIGAGLGAALAIAPAGCLLLLPPGIAFALTRRRPDWRAVTATSVVLLLLTGALLLDAASAALFPERPTLAATLQLGLLLPYAVLAARSAPRLLGHAPGQIRAWLGMGRGDWTTLLLALTLTLAFTLPWPITGALGDSLVSLGLVVQVVAESLPWIVLLWGVTFRALNDAYPRPWLAALLTTLLYSCALSGVAALTGNWIALLPAVLLLPLALLLTELRARDSSVWPLLPVLIGFRLLPRLFTDPRDVTMGGIPVPQHLLSYLIMWGTVTLAGMGLWTGRKLAQHYLTPEQRRHPAWTVAAALSVLLFAGAWGGGYLSIGNPGFNNDGFLIIMEEQADLQAAYDIADREARLQFAYDTLRETAERTQAPVRAELEALRLPYRPYYISNMIRVEGRTWRMQHFEALPGVARVIRNPNVRAYPQSINVPYGADPGAPEGTQSNLTAIHVDEAWALGATGAGIVVAGQDTGYDWSHPALQPHYRGWDGTTATHDYNWHDAWDAAAVPFDDDSHGTHTMGTMLGDDGGDNHTGVAPGAQWIGCRNMRRGIGNPGSYAECMEFFLAPYPYGGDPFVDGEVALAPHIINNSWGCPEEEGCFADTLHPAADALRAAGIMMVVSAGNEGPGCNTVATPPAMYDSVFSVGATDDYGFVTGFSSRGPAADLLKPDVSAPGDYVRSSLPGGGYGTASGTSMAGPHVAGAVALIWSADPALIGDIDATEALICETAFPHAVENSCAPEETNADSFWTESMPSSCACGDTTGTPNNVYGCGSINVGEAVRVALRE